MTTSVRGRVWRRMRPDGSSDRFLWSLQVYNRSCLNVFELTFISLDVNYNTGYDWSHVTDSTKDEQTTITVEAVAPAGLTKSKSENDNIFPNLRLGPHG